MRVTRASSTEVRPSRNVGTGRKCWLLWLSGPSARSAGHVVRWPLKSAASRVPAATAAAARLARSALQRAQTPGCGGAPEAPAPDCTSGASTPSSPSATTSHGLSCTGGDAWRGSACGSAGSGCETCATKRVSRHVAHVSQRWRASPSTKLSAASCAAGRRAAFETGEGRRVAKRAASDAPPPPPPPPATTTTTIVGHRREEGTARRRALTIRRVGGWQRRGWRREGGDGEGGGREGMGGGRRADG